MWARIVEIILGIWLLSSPWIFGHADLATDIICGIAVVVLAVLSLGPLTRAHFVILLVAAWLVLDGYIVGYPAPPPAQNRIIVGILLGMFAIIPTRIAEMPGPWQRLYAEHEDGSRTKSNGE